MERIIDVLAFVFGTALVLGALMLIAGYLRQLLFPLPKAEREAIAGELRRVQEFAERELTRRDVEPPSK